MNISDILKYVPYISLRTYLYFNDNILIAFIRFLNFVIRATWHLIISKFRLSVEKWATLVTLYSLHNAFFLFKQTK